VDVVVGCDLSRADIVRSSSFAHFVYTPSYSPYSYPSAMGVCPLSSAMSRNIGDEGCLYLAELTIRKH
jgi:hypothetical protein